MTSDAKIGLLVGLSVIFIIAFIINGLPRLRSDQSGNQLTTNMSDISLDSPGLGARERQAQQYFMPSSNLTKAARHAVMQQKNESEPLTEPVGHIRSSVPLPTSRLAQQTPFQSPVEKPIKDTVIPRSIAAAARDVMQNKSFKNNLNSLIYEVKTNDSLASIAKTFYGPVEGNKKKNIERLFGANRLKLKSPDKIYIGQKLIIPPLPQRPFSERLSDVTLPVTSPSGSSPDRTENNKTNQQWYIVREGDSLWKIAQQHFGNGARYMDIARLNADVLSNEDQLSPGTRLKLPHP